MALEVTTSRNGAVWTARTTGRSPGVTPLFHTEITVDNSDGAVVVGQAGSDTVTEPIPVASGSRLVPGEDGPGDWPETEQPPDTGNATANGYIASQNAIARWNVVPNQTFDADFNVGVVAFHSSGISYVAISVNGGAWTNVGEPSENPTTGVVEYWATLQASDFGTDGQIELRAIAYPNIGTPRVLQGTGSGSGTGDGSLYLVANAGESLTSDVTWVATDGDDSTGDGSEGNPFRTICRAGVAMGSGTNGGTVYLKAGSYTWAGVADPWPEPANNTTRWFRVTRAPGLDVEDVTLGAGASNQRLNNKLVMIEGVTISSALTQKNDNSPSIYYKDCSFVGSALDDDSSATGNGWTARYAENCTLSTMQNGFCSFDLVLDCSVDNIGEDAFSDSLCIINCTASNITQQTDLHADVVQYQGPSSNVIIYGLTATTGMSGVQGISGGGNTDMAVVNVAITCDSHLFYMDWRQGDGTVTNLLMQNAAFAGAGDFSYSLPSSGGGPVVYVGTFFEDVTDNGVLLTSGYDGITYREGE